jgi:LPXTG-site transpeptidase (sortase) family protein
MHYHIAATAEKSHRLDTQRLLGIICLAVFLALVGKIWVPYAMAAINATAIHFLPPDWAENYIAATLPKTNSAHLDNTLIIDTPDLHIKAPIVEGGSNDDLLRGVAHDPASVPPGAVGRAIISGHRFWPSSSPWATVFFSLDKLKVGDKVTIVYNNQTFVYHVTDTWELPKDKAPQAITPTTKPVLTLYTCGPTPYSSKDRMGFNAALDETTQQQDAKKVMDTIQDGIL